MSLPPILGCELHQRCALPVLQHMLVCKMQVALLLTSLNGTIVQVLGRMKQLMVDNNTAASHSFLLDDDSSIPFSLDDIAALMEDKVRAACSLCISQDSWQVKCNFELSLCTGCGMPWSQH